MNDSSQDTAARFEAAWRCLLREPAPDELMRARVDRRLAAGLLEKAIGGWMDQACAAADDALLGVACALPMALPLDLRSLVARCASREHSLPSSRKTILAWVLGRADRASRAALAEDAATDAGWRAAIEMQVMRTPPWAPVEADIARPDADRTASSSFATRDGHRESAPPSGMLQFTLRGEQVAGRSILAGSVAELALRDGEAIPDAVLRLSSDGLALARETNVDVLLLLTARGEISIEGPPFARAVFAAGRLDAPLRFRLRASARGGEGTVHVDFLVKGESVHQCEIALQAVDSLRARQPAHASNGETPPALDTLAQATRIARPPTRQLRLSLGLPGGRFCLGLVDLHHGETEFVDDFVEPDWGRVELEALLKGLDAALSGCYDDTAFWTAYDGTLPEGEAHAEAQACLARTCEAVVHAGAWLNTRLRESPRISAALDYIEANAPPGALISISTDDVFLPWEILYPRPWPHHATAEMRLAHPLDSEALWGARFAIETEKRGIGSLHALRERHRRSPPKASINLNPDITVRGVPPARQPLAVHRAWARALDDEGLLESVNQSCDGMRNVLQNADSAATLLYVFCHGDSPRPLAGTSEVLHLDDDCALEPGDLRYGKAFDGAPIVVLNSCRGAVSSPLAFGGFLKEFHRRGALGMIAASYAVPIVFGAHFGAEVVRCALRPAGALADAMRVLRRRHLGAGNPVPLLYALQCHLDTEDAP